ncbi:MAG TPA: hypothetical protein VHE54_15805 [Puia sp.]|nr:hypothetical protein [Puia sp.]
MNTTNAVHKVEMEFSKPPAHVFQHVIDLSRWWPEEVEGECSGPGDELVFRSGDSITRAPIIRSKN